MQDIDYLILGSGIAGLRAALELANNDEQVLIITKNKLEDSNTLYAQGGITAVDPKRVEEGRDSYESLTNDTIKAGAGISDKKVAEDFSKESFSTIEFLIENGVDFTKSEGDYPYILHQEGGHDCERIYCVGDYTGKAIEEALCRASRNNKNITILEDHTAIDLITEKDTVLGVYVLEKKTGKVKTIASQKVFLATGGAGRVFQYTSNPKGATGDGTAMAYKAGAKIANMEFFQFHPTVLYEDKSNETSNRRFLLTEALRGKMMGGILTLSKDSVDDLVLAHHPDGSHATRDVVARAIDTEIKNRGLTNVWLNVTPEVTGKSAEYIKENYPQIYKKCLEKGIDMTKEAVPVVPAAHYTCGGVVVDENGLTDIKGLYAIGEVSYTGLMGANRLASNSLPEGAIYGKRAVDHAMDTIQSNSEKRKLPEWNYGKAKEKPDIATMNQFWDTTRQVMTNLCGIDRNEQRLKLAYKVLDTLYKTAEEIYWDYIPTHEIIELRNITLNAKLIAESALMRKESRGGHYRSDYPSMKKEYEKPTILQKRNSNHLDI